MATIKVKPWGEGQGAFVMIEEKDFDPQKHELYREQTEDAEQNKPKRGRPSKDK